MQVCIVYLSKGKDSPRLRSISEGLRKGLEGQVHNVDILNIADSDGTRLTIYDYVIIGTEPVSFFSAGVSPSLRKFLENAGMVSGKRCMAFVSGGLRKNRLLLNLMKEMESQGMILKLSEIIRKEDEALAIGKRLNVERNY